MEIIRDLAHVGEKSFAQVAAAIGTFDGVYRRESLTLRVR